MFQDIQRDDKVEGAVRKCLLLKVFVAGFLVGLAKGLPSKKLSFNIAAALALKSR